jgi:hypothetical protein
MAFSKHHRQLGGELGSHESGWRLDHPNSQLLAPQASCVTGNLAVSPLDHGARLPSKLRQIHPLHQTRSLQTSWMPM